MLNIRRREIIQEPFYIILDQHDLDLIPKILLLYERLGHPIRLKVVELLLFELGLLACFYSRVHENLGWYFGKNDLFLLVFFLFVDYDYEVELFPIVSESCGAKF